MIFAANLANYEKLLQQKYEVSSSIWHKGGHAAVGALVQTLAQSTATKEGRK